VNPFGAEQLGYTAEELIGRPVQNLFHEADSPANLAERLVWPPEMSATGRAEHHTTRLPTLPNRLATPERTLRRRFVMLWRSERFARGTGLGCDRQRFEALCPHRGLGVFRFQSFRAKGSDCQGKGRVGMRLLSHGRREEGPRSGHSSTACWISRPRRTNRRLQAHGPH
jgi:PAS domain-containing protein